MLISHTRQEVREGQQRPINKEYYYVDFHITIDAIKYRVLNLTKKVQALYQPSEERKDYHCPRCKADWTELEVLDRGTPEGFECHRCDALLERDDRAAGATGHEKHGRLMSQFERLLTLMQEIDNADIPKNDFEDALSHAVPIARDEVTNPQRQTVPVDAPKAKPATVKGVTQAAAPLSISLTTASEKTAAEQEAEAKRKAAIAAQNQLPEWHTTSTVTGKVLAAGVEEQARQSNDIQLGTGKAEEDEKKDDIVRTDELGEVFALIAKENAAKGVDGDSEEEEEEDDDEDLFEDVAVGQNSNTTASVSSATVRNGAKGALNGAIKDEGSESGSGGRDASTPVGSQSITDDHGGPPVKKVKLEENENGPRAASPQVDSDEDDEFEDAF